MLIGVDYHPGFQQIASLVEETGENSERRSNHNDGEAEKFYRDLQALAMNEGRARVNGQLMLTVRLESRWRRARFGGKMYLASHVERPGSNWVGEDR